MKYPQLVSMPSAVQDWLDEQLEARGIDAVVYTRYILSLLQRDTLDLPDDLLTNKEVGRRGRKRGRREDYWDVWDCEQLKRSAAVECLMSASDQKCGIEKLVDELCAKLKEIQSEGENVVNTPVSTSQSPAQSFQDQVHKYYAAFPPLNSKASETGASVITLIPDRSSAWAGKKVFTNSFYKKTEKGNLSKLAEEIKDYKQTGYNNMKHGGQLLDQLLDIEKEVGYGFALNMASERNELFSDFCPLEFGSKNGSDLLRVFKCNKQNEYGFDGKNTAVKPAVCRRLYERQIEDDEMALEKLENILQDGLEDSESTELSPKQGLDENNLAQLIAKFDHSIEAIWNPEDAQSPSTNPDEIWSLDFQQLLSSPSEQLLTVELCSLNSKPSSENNSFIQCGTNIINSIWSDNTSKEHEEIKMDCVLGEQNVSSEDLKETAATDSCKENLNVHGKFQVVSVDDQNTTAELITDNSLDLKSDSNEECSILFGNFEKSEFLEKGSPKERSKISWNKLESFPSFFTSVSWGSLNYSVGGLPHSISKQKWSDVLDFTQDNPLKPNQQLKTPTEEKENCSFNTLNHNREDSSFTEVIPKSGTEFSTSHTNDVALKSIQEADLVDNETQKEHHNDAKKDIEKDVEKDEEDLLTSNRTHFRPIRQESLDSRNTAGCYADGTTFAISNNLEDVSFKRSESGALYLESDVGAETPRKYMEYKEKEPYGGRLKCENLSPTSVTHYPYENNFIPKFCVKQTEKCCQTEEADEVFTSDEEIDPKRSRHDKTGESDVSDFFFPGDEQCAEKIINCLEDDGNEFIEPCLTCCHQEKKLGSSAPCANHRTTLRSKDHCRTPLGNPEVGIQNWSSTMKSCCNCNNNNLLAWNNGWLKTSNPGLPKNVWEASENEETSKLPQSWYDIWCGTPDPGSILCPNCCESPPHAGVESGRSLQYCRLRKELREDGEQLLSDLSYLQHLYLGSDDQGEQELLPPQKLQCLSPPGESTQELQLYDDETRYTRSLVEYHNLKEELIGTEIKSKDDKVSPSILLKKLLLPTKQDAECKPNERPFDARASQKDRKRRHSASQRICNFYLDGNCERSLDLAAVPHQFWADSSCMKGLACSSFHGCVRAFRPVTL